MSTSPSGSEFVAIGSVGIFLFLVILLISAYDLKLLDEKIFIIKHSSTFYFYVTVILVSIFEFPRYIYLIIDQSYVSQAAYSLHIIAGIFFFIAFSIECFL